MKLLADINFNRDDDEQEYGIADKVVRVCRFKEDDRHKVTFSFELGRREDDTLDLVFNFGELLTAIASCEEEKQ